MALIEKISQKLNWKTVAFFLVAFAVLAFLEGVPYALKMLILFLVLSLNGVLVIDILGYLRSKIPLGQSFKFLFAGAVFIDLAAFFLGYGAVVAFFGVFVPLVFAFALLVDDWLRAFWAKLKASLRKK